MIQGRGRPGLCETRDPRAPGGEGEGLWPEQAVSWWLQQVPAVLWATDRELTITAHLGAGLADLNLAPNQLAGTRLTDYLRTSDPAFPALAAHLRALQGEPACYEQDWMGRTYRARVEPLRGDRGTVEGCVGLAVDVTDERRLRAQYTVTRALAEATSAAGAMARVLQAVCECLGWDLGALWAVDRSAGVL